MLVKIETHIGDNVCYRLKWGESDGSKVLQNRCKFSLLLNFSGYCNLFACKTKIKRYACKDRKTGKVYHYEAGLKCKKCRELSLRTDKDAKRV